MVVNAERTRPEQGNGAIAPGATRTLYQRVTDIMHDLSPVEKSGRVNFGSTKYSYVTAEALFATLQKKMATAGLVVVPMIDAVGPSPSSEKVLLVSMRFRLVNADDPSDYIEAPWAAQAPATDDKAVNKAGTSGEKYWLMKLFLISDEEDPDADSHTDTDHAAEEQRREDARTTKAAARGARSSASTAPSGPAAPAAAKSSAVDRAVMEQTALDLLQQDAEAADVLKARGKVVATLSDEELRNSIAWLRKRAVATRTGQTFWVDPSAQPAVELPDTPVRVALLAEITKASLLDEEYGRHMQGRNLRKLTDKQLESAAKTKARPIIQAARDQWVLQARGIRMWGGDLQPGSSNAAMARSCLVTGLVLDGQNPQVADHLELERVVPTIRDLWDVLAPEDGRTPPLEQQAATQVPAEDTPF